MEKQTNIQKTYEEAKLPEVLEATFKWLQMKLSILNRKLDKDDVRKKYFDNIMKYYDKLEVRVNKLSGYEKIPSLKFGLNDSSDKNGFIFPLSANESENFQNSIPEEMFQALCIHGMQKELDMIAQLNYPDYYRIDFQKIKELKEIFETSAPDNQELKKLISFFAVV